MESKKLYVRNLTPDENSCFPFPGCPSIYDLTPDREKCAIGLCPAIYEITPEEENCVAGACPSIHDSENVYLIVGEKVNPADVGLEEKVGDGEALIKIKKEIIDNRKSI